jgi:6-phosphogluconolactonase
MANRTLLSKVELRARQIHRILGEQSPEQAALAYEAELRDCFGLAPGEFPQFNLVLLGIGEDCHTASLFPQSPALHESERIAIAVEVDAPQRQRITLTPPVFNHAARVMFLASGKNKAQAVKNILEGPRDPERFPAQLIAPEGGEILWIIDKAAASLLT